MTVIVWDGKTLAADKMAVQGGLKRPVTKIKKINGNLCAISGDWDLAQETFEWFAKGADPEKLPPYYRDKDDWQPMLVITPMGRVIKYERSPYPMEYTESVETQGFYAMGSGRDFAIGAIAMGADAIEAVRVASLYCDSCGMGIDSVRLGE